MIIDNEYGAKACTASSRRKLLSNPDGLVPRRMKVLAVAMGRIRLGSLLLLPACRYIAFATCLPPSCMYDIMSI